MISLLRICIIVIALSIESHARDVEQLVSIVQTPATTETELKSAISELTWHVVPAQKFMTIANDSRFSDEHWRICMIEGLVRGLRPEMPIEELRQLLSNPQWLAVERITEIGGFTGYVPINTWPLDITPLLISLGGTNKNDTRLYLNFSGGVGRRIFVDIMKQREPTTSMSVVKEAAITEGTKVIRIFSTNRPAPRVAPQPSS